MQKSRHFMVRVLALLLAFGMIAAACGGDSEPESTETEPENSDTTGTGDGAGDDSAAGDDGATEEVIVDDPEDVPVQGGTLRYGLEADVDGLNPTASALSAPGLMMANAVFDSLIRFDTEGNWVPYLAESFTPNDDFSTWTMKLREGIMFHDGTEMTIDAVIGAFETQRNDPLVGLAVKPYYPEENAVVRIDDYTAEWNPIEPDARFPTRFAGALGYVPSPTWLAAALEDPTLDQQPVGTGPFKFDSRSEDSVTRFVRNDDYWAGEVFLDAIEFVPVTDSNTRTDLLLNNELNGMQTTNPEDIDLVRSEDSVVAVEDDTGEESFVMLNSESPPFNDIRARQALTWATPKQNYLDLIGLGVLRDANQMFTPESKFYNADLVQEADDPDRAVAMAAEYCADVPDSCTDGKINMEFQYSGPSVVQTRIAEILDEGWSVAFNVEFEELAQDQHIQQAVFGQYNAVTWRLFGAVNPNNDSVWQACRTIGAISLNWTRSCVEERDAAVLAAGATLDEDTYVSSHQEVSRINNEEYLYVFLTHTLWMNAFADNVKGVCAHTDPTGDVTLLCALNGRTWFDNVWIAE